MLDHLGVVVTRQKRLTLATGRHRQEADEIGKPGKRRLLQLRMFVPVVIDVPGFIGNDQIVVTLFDCILKDHEVRDQHLVHSAQRLEGVKIMLTRFQFDVPGLACKPGAERMDTLAIRIKQTRHGILCQPIDLQSGCSVRNSRVMAMSRRPCPSPMGEER
jgi:hypothetical protein